MTTKHIIISIADALVPSIATGMLANSDVTATLAVSGLFLDLAAFTAFTPNRSVRKIPSSYPWKPYIATLKWGRPCLLTLTQ